MNKDKTLSNDQKEDDFIIPVEMAVGKADCSHCVLLLTEAKIPFIRISKSLGTMGVDSGFLYRVKLEDAIKYNENLREGEGVTEGEICNAELRLATLREMDEDTLKVLWKALGCKSSSMAWEKYLQVDTDLITH